MGNSARLLWRRGLGIAAATGFWLSRRKVNGIPYTVLPFVCLIAGTYGGLGGAMLSLHDGSTPVETTLGEINRPGYLGSRFVRVSGVLHPEVAFEVVERKSGEETRSTFVGLSDPDSNAAIMVKLSPAADISRSGKAAVEGMLDSSYGLIRQNQPETLDGVRVSISQTLEEGARPVSPWLLFPIGLLSTLLLGMCVTAKRRRWVIFYPYGVRDLVPSARGETRQLTVPDDIMVSGTFTLPPGFREHFLRVPLELVTFEDGSKGFTANIDASVKKSFYYIPVRTEERRGAWTLRLGVGGIMEMAVGSCYHGLHTFPAVRIRYLDVETARPMSAVVTVASEAERDAVVAALSEQQPEPMSSAR